LDECKKRQAATLDDLRAQEGRRATAAKKCKTLKMGGFGAIEDEVEGKLKQFRSFISTQIEQNIFRV